MEAPARGVDFAIHHLLLIEDGGESLSLLEDVFFRYSNGHAFNEKIPDS